MVWRFLFNERFGLINQGLAAIGLGPVDWLGNPATSIPAILIFVTWKVFGYNMIVFTAALAAVPQDLMEAARLDGASRWTRFRHVTLPAIGPTLLERANPGAIETRRESAGKLYNVSEFAAEIALAAVEPIPADNTRLVGDISSFGGE